MDKQEGSVRCEWLRHTWSIKYAYSDWQNGDPRSYISSISGSPRVSLGLLKHSFGDLYSSSSVACNVELFERTGMFWGVCTQDSMYLRVYLNVDQTAAHHEWLAQRSLNSCTTNLKLQEWSPQCSTVPLITRQGWCRLWARVMLTLLGAGHRPSWTRGSS